MSRRYYHINDPAFSEYVFHCMMTCPEHKRNELSPQELKYFKDEVAIRKFAENETLDKRIMMLTRIGALFTMVMSFSNPRPVFEGLLSQYQTAEYRSDLIKAMNERKMFVFGTKDLTDVVNYAAQNSHSQVYVLNYEYVKQYEYLRNIKKKTYNDDMKSAAKFFELAATLFLNANISMKAIEGIAGVSEYELKILLALYKHRNTYVTRDTLAVWIGESRRTRGVSKVADGLIKKDLILKMQGSGRGQKPLQYTLSSEGVNVVCKYVKYVVAQSNN